MSYSFKDLQEAILGKKKTLNFKNTTIRFKDTLFIDRPLTLRNLHAEKNSSFDGKENRPLIVVTSPNVTLINVKFFGIIKGKITKKQDDDRKPLLEIQTSHFKVLNCSFENGTGEGVLVKPGKSGSISGPAVMGYNYRSTKLKNLRSKDKLNLIANIKALNMGRDAVAVSSNGKKGLSIRNVIIYNITLLDRSFYRGAVEVSNGCENIQVWKVRAYNAENGYGVDIQDHGDGAPNRNIKIEDVVAKDCKHVIKTANSNKKHQDLELIDIKSINCPAPIDISNTDGVTIKNLRITNKKKKFENEPIRFDNCQDITITDFRIRTTKTFDKSAIRLEGNRGNWLKLKGNNSVKKLKKTTDLVKVNNKQSVTGDDKVDR